jgi:hypothetical protein
MRIEALSPERARLYMAATWGSWLSLEEGVGIYDMQEAKAFAYELGISWEELRDRLVTMYPSIAREFVRQATGQAEAERRFAEILEKEIRSERISFLQALDKMQEFRTA